MTEQQAHIGISVDEDLMRRIRQAAALENLTVEEFTLKAAEQRADRAIDSHSATVFPADFFDELVEHLDEPGEPNEALERIAAAPRRVSIRDTFGAMPDASVPNRDEWNR